MLLPVLARVTGHGKARAWIRYGAVNFYISISIWEREPRWQQRTLRSY